jgi:hypothetical protein
MTINFSALEYCLSRTNGNTGWRFRISFAHFAEFGGNKCVIVGKRRHGCSINGIGFTFSKNCVVGAFVDTCVTVNAIFCYS